MDFPLMLRLLSSSVKVSSKAGSIIRQVMSSGNLGIVDKGVNDLQTLADRTAQACIVKSLQMKFPGICIIGEETLSDEMISKQDEVELTDDDFVLQLGCPKHLKEVKLDDVVVWVDPLDGTSEYTQGLVEHVTVLIGLAVKGEAVGGVIHQPYSPGNHNEGRSIYALQGMGVFNSHLGKFSHEYSPPTEHNNILTTTRGHGTALVQEALDYCLPTEIMRVGGCGHKVLLLLEGRCHAYIFASPGCKKWDTCAPQAILHEVGGLLTDMLGRPISYHRGVEHTNQCGVLATAQKSWHSQYYLGRIPKSIQDHLDQATSCKA